MSLTGKVALITGAAQGLGKAFSEALLKKGAKVCVADVQSKKGEVTVSAFQQEYGLDKAMFVKCDVSSVGEMQNAFTALLDRFGRLDIMVNNAGIINEEDPERVVDINVKGVITGTNLAVEVMNKEKGGNGGVIINVASTAGVTSRGYMCPSYTASKFAVSGFTQCWSHNRYLTKMGLRFACLCPAFTDTEILSSTKVFYPSDMEKMVEKVGINDVSTVVEGFMQLVEDEWSNGAVMVITRHEGIQFYKKPLAHSKM
ncbi:15-hydroxyprostaglandin dehydrogenase [NAD(+)]-like [Babylonia areolata]|uniref:15-hydroxyprostaglandin dehydrogenase [NAD(+)]-like n=1 Tax=Babylonia areolata TaxID=304850 RepID=UPI003FCF1852